MASQSNFLYEVYANLDICSTFFCLVLSQMNGTLQLWAYLFCLCVWNVMDPYRSWKSHWFCSCTWSLNLFLLGPLRLLNLGYFLTSSPVIFCFTFSDHTDSFALPWGTQSLLRVLVFCLKLPFVWNRLAPDFSSHRQTLLKCHLHREIFPDVRISNSSPSILLLSSPHSHFIFIFHPHYLFFLVIRYTYHNLKKIVCVFFFPARSVNFIRPGILFFALYSVPCTPASVASPQIFAKWVDFIFANNEFMTCAERSRVHHMLELP